MEVLYQLSYVGIWAGDETRTRDPQLGRLMLYQLSYSRILLWAGMDLNHRRRTPADLQSAAIDHSATDPLIFKKHQSHWRDSNPRPADYKSAALTNWATMA